jgi:hypothetical protein
LLSPNFLIGYVVLSDSSSESEGGDGGDESMSEQEATMAPDPEEGWEAADDDSDAAVSVISWDDAIMGDEGAHLKRAFTEFVENDKKMPPAKKSPKNAEMLFGGHPQVWDKDSRTVETKGSPKESEHNAYAKSNTDSFDGVRLEQDDGNDPDL